MALPRWSMCLLVLFLQLATGCAWLPSGPPPELSFPVETKARIDDIPFFAQEAFQCGPATLAMVLQWSGVPATPEELVPLVYTPLRKGSLQPGMITGGRRRNRLTYPIYGLDCLLREIESGHPVIVLQNLGLGWFPKWHYALVMGYDLNDHTVVLHTGKHAARRVGMSTFMRTWRRGRQWGMLVLPADTMPVCAEEQPYLMAALGLQQAGFVSSAATAFRQASIRWPQSLEARISLGNALYDMGEMKDAIKAFSAAVALDASNGPALNNLAHVLAKSGDLDLAETMARRAISVGGAHARLYRQTLQDVLRLKDGSD